MNVLVQNMLHRFKSTIADFGMHICKLTNRTTVACWLWLQYLLLFIPCHYVVCKYCKSFSSHWTNSFKELSKNPFPENSAKQYQMWRRRQESEGTLLCFNIMKTKIATICCWYTCSIYTHITLCQFSSNHAKVNDCIFSEWKHNWNVVNLWIPFIFCFDNEIPHNVNPTYNLFYKNILLWHLIS